MMVYFLPLPLDIPMERIFECYPSHATNVVVSHDGGWYLVGPKYFKAHNIRTVHLQDDFCSFGTMTLYGQNQIPTFMGNWVGLV
jgi:hypothetical protein